MTTTLPRGRGITVAVFTVATLLPALARAQEDAGPPAPTQTPTPTEEAQQPQPDPQPPLDPRVRRMRAPDPPPYPPSPDDVPVAPTGAPSRSTDLEPKAAAPAPKKLTFAADPVADGGIIIGAAGFAWVLELINSTGEIRPQQISIDRSQLLSIDRDAADQNIDQDSRTRSNITLFSAAAFAAIDPVLTGFREKHVQAGLVDGIIYAQSIALTWGVTNLAKIAVRRPRPAAYIECEKQKESGVQECNNADTDSSLSFFSGHASITATIAATATYLAFVRAPNLWRPLITLGVGTAVTTFTAVERVRGGAHFPTDVIAGAVAGAGIGVIVTHLHRSEDVLQRRVWVGFAPSRGSGGTMELGGFF